MEKKQEQKIQGLSNKIAEFEVKNNEKFAEVQKAQKNIENKIDSKIFGVENKIAAVENKISGVELKINEIDTDLKKELQILSKNNKD